MYSMQCHQATKVTRAQAFLLFVAAKIINAWFHVTFIGALNAALIQQAWLTEKDGDDQEGDGASSMAFSRNAPFSVMSVMSHALPDEQGDSSHTPCFYMCSRTQQRLKADIVMPSKECDYRLFVKTCKKLANFIYLFVACLCPFVCATECLVTDEY